MTPAYSTGDNITSLNNTHSLLHISKGIMDACDLGKNPYRSFPSVFTLTSSVSQDIPAKKSVQPNSYYSLLGQCLLIGVIDTGVDYQHQAFRNEDGTTRIFSIWDQTQQSGQPPEGFTFGTEYSRQQINTALLSDNSLSLVPSTDTNGHGTAIASIIAGSTDFENTFSGTVPYTELVIVKLKQAKQNLKKIFFIPEDTLCFQESDIILGIRYLTAISRKLTRPLVICLAMGNSQGSHDGQGITSRYLENLVHIPGIDVSIAAGDEGNSSRHYFNNIISAPYNNYFKLNIGNNDKRFAMEIWPYAPGRFSIEITSPDLETTGMIEASFNKCHSLTFDQGTIWVNNIIFEEETGEQLILIRFENPMPGIWSFRIQSSENQSFYFHSWLPSGNLISNETYFLNASPDTTITNPGNSFNTMTVTAYNQFDCSILDESSRGYTSISLVKPDIAAPGYQIPCAVPGNQYGTMTGTGAAAAQAAGGIAMFMEWTHCKGNYTALTGKQINRIIIRGALRNSAYIYPNNIWGYGQLDVNELIDRIISIL